MITYREVDFHKSPSSISYGAHETSHDFVARGRPLRGQKRRAPLAKRSTCIKSNREVTVSVNKTNAMAYTAG